MGTRPDVATDRQVCPRCQRLSVGWLTSMRGYDEIRDWFKCDGCGHIFTTPRSIEEDENHRAAS